MEYIVESVMHHKTMITDPRLLPGSVTRVSAIDGYICRTSELAMHRQVARDAVPIPEVVLYSTRETPGVFCVTIGLSMT